MPVKCWPGVCDAGPTLRRHWRDVQCFLSATRNINLSQGSCETWLHHYQPPPDGPCNADKNWTALTIVLFSSRDHHKRGKEANISTGSGWFILSEQNKYSGGNLKYIIHPVPWTMQSDASHDVLCQRLHVNFPVQNRGNYSEVPLHFTLMSKDIKWYNAIVTMCVGKIDRPGINGSDKLCMIIANDRINYASPTVRDA